MFSTVKIITLGFKIVFLDLQFLSFDCDQSFTILTLFFDALCIWFYFRANRAYWENLKPASGRPFCPSFSGPGGAGKSQ